MRNSVKSIAIVTSLLIVGTTRVLAAGWSANPVQVAKIDQEDSSSGLTAPKTFVTFVEPPMTTNCSNNSSGYWQLKGTADHIKNILQIALSAKLSGKVVKVYWNDQCSNGGTSGYPVLAGLELQ